MLNQSTVEDITCSLARHEKSRRIKKLIFCACKNVWQNDQNILDGFQLSDLIQELYNNNPTIDHANYTLSQVVNTLNKPGEYSLVANIILGEIEQLYIVTEEETGIIFNNPYGEETTTLASDQSEGSEISSSLAEELNTYQVKYEYNPFDLRQNIMKYTNPLRAKMVLFAALNNQLSFQKDEWSKLREEKLDNLLRNIFEICDTFEQLELRLENTISYLGDNEEYIQAIGAILQCMRNLYGTIAGHVDPQNQKINKIVVNSNYQLATTETSDPADESYNNNTYQLIQPPANNLSPQIKSDNY